MKLFAKLGAAIVGAATIVAGVASGAQLLGTPSEPAIPDVSGAWLVTNRIESTEFIPYRGLRMGYRIFLTQSGSQLSGFGEKDKENGVQLPEAGRAPMTIHGTVSDTLVHVTFSEQGARRQTSGSMTWTIGPVRDSLVGSFQYTAATSSGSSVALREGG